MGGRAQGGPEGLLRGRVGLDYIGPGTLWNNSNAESLNSLIRRELLSRNHWPCLLVEFDQHWERDGRRSD